jgi:hypothetical protein
MGGSIKIYHKGFKGSREHGREWVFEHGAFRVQGSMGVWEGGFCSSFCFLLLLSLSLSSLSASDRCEMKSTLKRGRAVLRECNRVLTLI